MKIPWLTLLYVIVHKFKLPIEYNVKQNVCLSFTSYYTNILIVRFDAKLNINYFHLFRLNYSIYIRADIVKKTTMTLLKSNYMPEKPKKMR